MIAGTDIVGRRARMKAGNPKTYPFHVAAVAFGVGTGYVLLLEDQHGEMRAHPFNDVSLEPGPRTWESK